MKHVQMTYTITPAGYTETGLSFVIRPSGGSTINWRAVVKGKELPDVYAFGAQELPNAALGALISMVASGFLISDQALHTIFWETVVRQHRGLTWLRKVAPDAANHYQYSLGTWINEQLETAGKNHESSTMCPCCSNVVDDVQIAASKRYVSDMIQERNAQLAEGSLRGERG